MKKFEVELTQDLQGWYNGIITIEAKNKESALKKLRKMSNRQIDELADWTISDQYNGNLETIDIIEHTIKEIDE